MPIGSPLTRPSSSAFFPVILLLLLVLAGCSVGDFLGAYFNTYYNAQRAFTEAETELFAAQDPKLAEKSFLPPYTVPAGAKTKFTSVIEKCSKLLQYHPESALVDDALMMIGKSYYYQNDYPPAIRKFRELIDGQPASDLVQESRLLLANTFYRSGARDSARAAARQILAAEDPPAEARFRARAALLLAAIELDDKNHRAALEHYAAAAGYADLDEDRHTAFLRAGDMHAELGEYEPAGAAYLRAGENAGTYVAEYRAALGQARMLAAMGRHDDALALLDRLLDDRKYTEFFAEMEFERGRIYRAAGETETAVEQFRYVDTAYVRTEFSARAAYELGQLYERVLLRYDSARAAYNRGRTVAGTNPIAAPLGIRADALNRYFTLVGEITVNDSLRALILAPPDTAATDSAAATRDSASTGTTAIDDISPPESAGADSGTVRDSSAPAALKPGEPSGHAAGDTSASADTTAALPAPQNDSLAAHAPAGADTASVRPAAPRVAIPLDTVMTRLAAGVSEMGALFFNVLERNDSSSAWFTRLLEQHPDSRHVPRALYTLAQIAAQDSQPALADSLYRVLAHRYPGDEFGVTAARLLGHASPEDTVDAAAERYAEAERTLEEGNHRSAIRKLVSIMTDFPDSPQAPKAQYAIGWIYESVAVQPDSALASYRAVAERFPTSPYAAVVKPRLDAIDQHLRKLEEDRKAAADSIRQQQISDSLKQVETAPPEAPEGGQTVQPEPQPGPADTSGVREAVKPDPEETPARPPEPAPEPDKDDEGEEPPPEALVPVDRGFP